MEAFAHTVQIHTKEEILEVRCGINTLEEQLEGKKFYPVPPFLYRGIGICCENKKDGASAG